MKKALSQSAVILCLFFLQMPYSSFAQDTRPNKREVRPNDHDRDDRDDRPEDADTPPDEDTHVHRHKSTVPRIALALETGVGVTDLQMGTTRSDLTIGGTIGAYADVHLGGRFYLQPGLFYVMNGGDNVVIPTVSSLSYPTRINTVEVPLTLTYKIGAPDRRVRYTVGVAGYYGYNAAADINGVALYIGTTKNDDLMPNDVGVGLNLGLELWNGLFFRMKTQRGLTNLQPDANKNAIYTESDAITIGYLFGKKTRRYRRPPMHPHEEYMNRGM